MPRTPVTRTKAMVKRIVIGALSVFIIPAAFMTGVSVRNFFDHTFRTVIINSTGTPIVFGYRVEEGPSTYAAYSTRVPPMASSTRIVPQEGRRFTFYVTDESGGHRKEIGLYTMPGVQAGFFTRSTHTFEYKDDTFSGRFADGKWVLAD